MKMANPFGIPGMFGGEELEKMRQNAPKTYQRHRELNDMLKQVKEMGVARFREIFGQEMLDELKDMAEKEQRLITIRQKILLQSKLMGDWPICEKCKHWQAHNNGGGDCPYDNNKYEKSIEFATGEIEGNEFPIELCEMFDWGKRK